ncbi:MAG TPA: methyltransferase domain-containing protein [Polyangiaceae bacterium]|nr:methyltransferase domain-containing protein [Polyangiaceae bacterium]
MTISEEEIRATLTYDCDESALPREIRSRFVRLDLGDEGAEFLRRALATRPGRAKTAMHRVLRTFVSDFDANGMLDMYPMHLLGTSQWRTLLGDRLGRHLDVGAGAGEVTKTLSPLLAETVTTETSRVMANKLRAQGFRCFEADLAERGVPDPTYDLVSCLNVIDRCAKPQTLLERVQTGLSPGGRLVLATPFPFDPFVYRGTTSGEPEERLPITRDSWERSVTRLICDVLSPLGLELESVSRVPYLCRGDASRPVYVLDDALVVCRKR